MEHFLHALQYNRTSAMGTLLTFTLGFIGRAALSDTALIMGILSGLATFMYTCWKWYTDYKKLHSSKPEN